MMFRIIGSRTEHEYGYGGWTGKKECIEEAVATFDCEKNARQYIKNAELKHAVCTDRPFKKRSVLANFSFATVEKMIQESVPHNPVI